MATKGIEIKDTDKGFKRIQKELEKAKGAYVKVGVLSEAGQYEDGERANLADVATWNEFGTTRIPSRPFMRQSFDRNVAELTRFMQAQKGNVISGAQTVKQALNTVGVFFTGKVKEIFVKGDFKENAIFTKLKKNKRFVIKATEKIAKLGYKEYKEQNKKFKTESAMRRSGARLSEIRQFKGQLKDFIKLGAGNTTPLIDTGRLRQSIQHEVVLGTKGKSK